MFRWVGLGWVGKFILIRNIYIYTGCPESHLPKVFSYIFAISFNFINNFFLNYSWIYWVFISPSDFPYYSTKVSPSIKIQKSCCLCEGQVIQKLNKVIFFDFFIWLDRAHQVLQEYIYWKSFKAFLKAKFTENCYKSRNN
jgi:hypothetical protein